jgi:hypothetical protein
LGIFAPRQCLSIAGLCAAVAAVSTGYGRNVAAAQPERVAALRNRMETALKAQNDPRMSGQGHIFDAYQPTSGAGFYEKFIRGEKPNAGWVSDSDFEPQPIKQP